MSDVVAEIEAKIEALKLRLPDLEGKANKKERTQVNKEIYTLENDEVYVAALKAQVATARAEAEKQDDAAHMAKLQAEEEAAEARRQRMLQLQEEKAKAGTEPPADDGEIHMEVTRLKKGDGATIPGVGDTVSVTYVGHFADGTEYQGVQYGGKQFDSTYDAKRKEDKPLSFRLGEGRVIRGWDECLKTMSVGESVKVVIGPKWAYRKGGVPDDQGGYVVPPNAALVFQMTLVSVKAK
mmetsp:Transcript_26185/g.59428  ORF Transcript_26185/g.59428 Transcript_26185/m.59428 type:complete len:238 (-) Transcript_26185:469-1182(-)